MRAFPFIALIVIKAFFLLVPPEKCYGVSDHESVCTDFVKTEIISCNFLWATVCSLQTTKSTTNLVKLNGIRSRAIACGIGHAAVDCT